MSSSADCVNAWTPSGPAPRAVLHVLMLPDLERAERIGEIIR